MGIIAHRRGLKHYSLHGDLPSTPYWNRLEDRRDLNPSRFDHHHPTVRGLFDQASTPGLMPDTPYWDRLRDRYELNAARFKHYHPFLGKLIERDARARDGLDNTPPPIVPPTIVPPIVIPPSVIPQDGGGGTITPGGGGGGSGGAGAVVPEPATAVLLATGLLTCAAIAGWRRRKPR